MHTSRLRSLSIAALLAALPLAAHAQQAAEEKLTFEPSGWLVLNTYANHGNLNALDLPRWAAPISPTLSGEDESAYGMQVRQSRLRLNVGIPTDGLIAGSKMRGFVEVDFMGGNAANGTDESLPLVRLRHAYVAVSWKDLGNLTLLVGQTWGILGGPYFADSLSHLAIPRFGGAGFLYRRAPQVRVSGEVGKTLSVLYALGAVAPMDQLRANSTSTIPAGSRSAIPNLEGRVGAAYRTPTKRGLEVGLSAHYGQEKYALNGVAGTPNQTVDSRALAVDAKLDLPYVTLKGAGFAGENLDVWYSYAPGVIQTPVSSTNPALTSVKSVATRGFWAQAVVTPVKPISLLLGLGMEEPRTAGISQQLNQQFSTGIIGNLTSRWRASLEFTRYLTDTATGNYDGSQVELSTLLAF